MSMFSSRKQRSVFILGVTAIVQVVSFGQGHSWLECTDYRIGSQSDEDYFNRANCKGYPRCGSHQASQGFGIDTGFDFRPTAGQPSCQCSRERSNAYSVDAPMAEYTPGQRVCLAYPAKNHVAAECQNLHIPDAGLKIFRGDRHPVSNDSMDATDALLGRWPATYSHLNDVHINGREDYKGFQNCPKFCENNDKALCTVCFDLEPDLALGVYTFQWEWNFNSPQDAYTTCWEARVVEKKAFVKQVAHSRLRPVPKSNPIHFETKHGKIYANGEEFVIKGANWFGFEEKTKVLHGLWGDLPSMDFALDFLKKHQFNALRIPFSVSTLLENPVIEADLLKSEPDMKETRLLEVLDRLIEKSAERNILILLDNHRLRPEAGITDLWYDGQTSVQEVKKAWEVLAQRYCASWNVFAADLKNEPHGVAEWGTGSAKDWRLGAEDLGNLVLTHCPRWLIFVEGVEGNIPGVSGTGWWGGRLQGVKEYPIRLTDDSKLVYSPHVYGPSVHMQPSFSVDTFPFNMRGIWEDDFGFVPARAAKPLVVGEYGGFAVGKDLEWHQEILSYLAKERVGSFYWSLNPNSADTGGLLKDDWKSAEDAKLQLLQVLLSTDVGKLRNA